MALTSPPVAKLLLGDGDFVGGKFEVTIFWWIAIILIVGFLLNFFLTGGYDSVVGIVRAMAIGSSPWAVTA